MRLNCNGQSFRLLHFIRNLGGKGKCQDPKPIKIMETVLRDAHQSLDCQLEMPTELMLPIAEKMDKVGYEASRVLGRRYSMHPCVSYMKIRGKTEKLRAAFKNTKLQMLLRGQNIPWISSLC